MRLISIPLRCFNDKNKIILCNSEYMDIIQQLATTLLLSMVAYFILINIFGSRSEALSTEGIIDIKSTPASASTSASASASASASTSASASASKSASKSASASKLASVSKKTQPSKSPSNPIKANRNINSQNIKSKEDQVETNPCDLRGSFDTCITNRLPTGLDLDMGSNVAFDIGEPVGDGNCPNTTTISVFNKEATGILPSNHSTSDEKKAEFGSNITNINQFYQNNPELFNRSECGAHIPDTATWERCGKDMFNKLAQAPKATINPCNNEDNFTSY